MGASRLRHGFWGGFEVGTEAASGHLASNAEPQALIQVHPGHTRSLPGICYGT